MNKKRYLQILFSCTVGFLAAFSSSFADSTTTYKEVIREDVFAAKTTADFTAAYSKSTDPASKIAVLNALPMAINRFQASTSGTTVPSWLGTLLTTALQDKDIKVVQTAVDAINKNAIVCFADALISMYGSAAETPVDPSIIVLRISIINALGTLGTPNAIVLLGKIIDTHQLRQETEAALNAVSAACATNLVPNINSYVKDLENKIQNRAFQALLPIKGVQIAPEVSLDRAYYVVRILGSENCGN
jgi:hypothetical protein